MPFEVGKREANFSARALEELHTWIATNPKIAKKLVELIAECCRNPYEGKGKPEGLKNNLKGYWSRRITDEHRLVYKVEPTVILIYSCHGHYE
ncbi:Txe/YoeB family addiction module toxin [Larkinella sp. GY13]|uniref:Txe/YoeB family addiction module toxin n=1 Tax=Larkinella sp. GY13 TaxID=3453720 RepID=UPI003EEC1158